MTSAISGYAARLSLVGNPVNWPFGPACCDDLGKIIGDSEHNECS